MKKNLLKETLAAFLLLITGIALNAAPLPKITASIDSSVVEMGSRAVITLDISDSSLKGRLINLPATGTETENVDFINVEADTFPAGYQYRLLIQAFIPGDVTFDPFKYVVESDTVESGFLSLKVLPVDLDSLETINPMASVVNVPRRWYDYIPDYVLWIILGVAVIAIAIALILIYRKHGSIIIHRSKPVDPYEEAMNELNLLKERRLAENGREKEYYTSLVDILRVYLERRFGINAMEMTSTQILSSLRSNPETRDNQPRIKQILEIADFVKFANVRPMSDDNIKTFNNVVQFVEDTKPVPHPEESEISKENTPSDNDVKNNK